MIDTLAEICDAKRKHIRACKERMSESKLLEKAKKQDAPRGFFRALQEKQKRGEFGLIAEVKKASPSKGVIRADFDPAAIAQAYVQGGAACISVLTDTPYFQGHDDYLEQVRAAVTLPLLRKDFMLDTYQIVESRALGADCILLIMAALTGMEAEQLEETAFALGMDVLVEVHDEAELQRAKVHLKSPMIGINNRNLKTLKVDIATSEKLAAFLPSRALGVSESGINSYNDLKRMQKVGISTFLVGESLMREADVKHATQKLLGAVN